MANKSDIRVRLSPEGLEEVLKAIRKVQQEGRRASKDAANGVTGLRNAVVALRSAVAVVGVGTFIRAIVRETVEAEQKLSQLDAVLRSTGEAAGFNREQLVRMAEEIGTRTIHSTDEIIEAQTRLLTYTTITGKEFAKAFSLQHARDDQSRDCPARGGDSEAAAPRGSASARRAPLPRALQSRRHGGAARIRRRRLCPSSALRIHGLESIDLIEGR